MNIEKIKVKTKDELEICSKLRKEVFGDEEFAPEQLYIIDELDNNIDTHNYLLKIDDNYVSTIRFIKIDDETIKIQRMVVPKKYRRNGYASIILKFLEEDAKEMGYKKIIMDSAFSAVPFYEKNDYLKKSDVFYEDGRPHVKMEKDII